MGAYLPKPVTNKESNDDENDYLKCGSSSMQGWRSSQEDSHNCILGYDNKTAFFAVYDGHGGSEVAIYCSQKLPNLLKELDEYKNNNIEEALKMAFLKIDSILLNEDVIEELKSLAMADEKNSDLEKCDEEEEDLNELYEESQMPLNKVFDKYKMDYFHGGKSEEMIKKMKAGCSKECEKGNHETICCSSSNKAVTTTSTTASNVSSISEDKNQHSSTSLKNEVDASISSSSSSVNENIGLSLTENTNSTINNCQVDVPDSSSGGSFKTDCIQESGLDTKSNGVVEKNDEKQLSNENTVKLNPSPDTQVPTNSTQNENVTSSSSTFSDTKCVAADSESTLGSSSNFCTSKSTKKTRSMPPVIIDSSEDSEEEQDATYSVESSVNSDESDEEDEENKDMDDETEYEESEEMDDMADEDDENTAFMDNIIEEPGKDSGCTAVLALLKNNELFVANAGDSRCVVCRDGTALEMSLDHKPEDELEHKRITNAGGRVTLDGRVNGGLNLSRAIGDHAYKMNTKLKPEEQMISALPDIKKITLTDKDEFMILACDGIWNSMTNEDVVTFIKDRLNKGYEKMSKICEELFDFCLAADTLGDGTGCDNMTAIIVKFKNSVPDGNIEVDEVVSRKRTADNNLNIDTVKRQKTDENEDDVKCSSTEDEVIHS